MIRFNWASAGTPRSFSLGLLLLSSLIFPSLSAGQNQPVLTWHGQIRPRLYGREPVEGEWDHWISMRTRFGVDARFDQGLGLFVQIQDVRLWGDEASHRDRSADAVDFHQAYLEVDSLPWIGGMVRGGRQEVELGEGRFIGAPTWGQAGQTFDGLRWIRPLSDSRIDLIYLRLREGSAEIHEHTAEFWAASLALPFDNLGSVDVLAIHDRSGEPDGNGQSTVGSIWKRAVDPFSFRVQGMYQFGERAGLDLSAYMIAARASLTMFEGRGTVSLWYDHLSGDSDLADGEIQAFSTLFGARHRYYGRSDYFLNIPDDTGGLGLRDAAFKLAYNPNPLLSVNLDLHSFHTAEKGDLSSQHLAEEADLWIKYRFRTALALEVGYSVTAARTAMEELERLDGTGNVVYFMTSLAF